MARLFWVCVAGALGSGARYLVGVWANARFGPAFPCGTLMVNVAGCLLMGFVMELALHASALSTTARVALTSGFLGGLTTYSSFNHESTRLLLDGSPRTGLLNIAATLGLCFGAGLLGLYLARRCAA